MRTSSPTSESAPIRHLLPVCRTVMATGILLFWAWYNADVIFKTQSHTLFLLDGDFFRDMLAQPAGLLRYVSRFFTHCGYFPLLGGTLLALLWLGVEMLQARALHLPDWLRPVSCLIPAVLTAAQTYAGYYIYTSYDGSLLFGLPLGLAVMYTQIILLRKLTIQRGGLWTGLLLTTLTYGLAGSFGWIGGLVAAIYAWCKLPARRAVLWTAAALLAAVVLPLAAYRFVWYAPLHVCRYAPLPDSSTPEAVAALAVAAVCTALLAAAVRLKPQKDLYRLALPALVLGMALCFLFSFRDTNFRAELRMQRLLAEGAFDEIIRRADRLPQPSRAVTAYRAIALDYNGQLGNALFRIPYAYTAIPAKVPAEVVHEREFSLFASCINNCYMVTMTQVVNYGLRPADLQFYALCALFNGEDNLAVKNLSTLGKTIFYRKWAAEHAAYLSQPEDFLSHPVYGRIASAMSDENQLTNGNANVIEFYLRLKQGERLLFERHLMDCLYLKNLDAFWARAPRIPDLFDEIPVHIQEALALIGIVDGEDISAYHISPAIYQRVESFIAQTGSFGNNFEAARTALESTYGNMYGYYYFFRSLLDTESEQPEPGESSVN
ncbi:MAG: hypothetical protein IJL64_06375 [Bacteroidales bacterium]|nr:hypothetical protein [Bacteroidales bacterium]